MRINQKYPEKFLYSEDRRFTDSALSLLGEHIITPEQFFKNSSEEMSEEKLLIHYLLADAIECVLLRVHPRYEVLPQSSKKLTDETMEWFFKGDVGQFTFHFVCDQLGVEPERIRGQLKKLLEKTDAHKALFAFRCQEFSQKDALFVVLSYKNNALNGNYHVSDLYRQFFCYVLRSITKPKMTYAQIGKKLDRRQADTARAYKNFFLSYIECVPDLLRIAENFYAYFYTVVNMERRAV